MSQHFTFLSALKPLAIFAFLLAGTFHLNGLEVQPVAPTISSIKVTGGQHDLSVAITATAPLTPRVDTVANPDRLIVDMPEVLPRAGAEKIPVNRGKLRSVRVALLSAKPRITRVVLDLMGLTAPYQLVPMGNTLVIKFMDKSGLGVPPIADTAKLPVATRLAATAISVVIPPPTQSMDQSPERSRARWIFPILFTATVLAMLVVSLVAHIQNRASRRGA